MNSTLSRTIVRLLSAAGLCLLLVACRGEDQESAPAVPEPGSGSSLGFDAAELADDVRPQDDFWRYVNGRWLDTTEVPADRSAHGSFREVFDTTEESIRVLVEEALAAVQAGEAEGAQAQIGALYASFLDTATLEELGLTPLEVEFAAIDALDDTAALARYFGKASSLGVTTPITQYADNDTSEGTRLILYLWQGGLGLPNRDYYLDDNEDLVKAREAYETHIANMFGLAGWDHGVSAASEIVLLETQLAQLHWTQVQSRDRGKIYSNHYDFAGANELLGSFPLGSWLEGYGMAPPDKLVVAQTDYFAGLAEAVEATPMSTWKNYLKFHVLAAFAPYLSEAFDEERFDFRSRKLRGQESQAPRWKRGVRLVNGSVGEALGQLYVDKHFPPASKQTIGELVENLRTAYGQAIRELEWMSAETKNEALKKLEGFLPKLGYPDEWTDYSQLEVGAGTLMANVLAARAFNHQLGLERMTRPVDKQEWTYPPQTVNAFYRPAHNSITFPAGILQEPLFDADSDPSMNYGAIGSIIGHEFSHGFDDQGRKFDATGLLRNWWTEEDEEKYQARSSVLVDQYNEYAPLPDTKINGELTLGENIGDLAGVTMAFRAFELSGLADGPEIEGFSPRERFFIGFAIAFRDKIREPYLRELLIRDSHSPGQYRVMGVLANMPEFYETYGVTAEDGMYLPPDKRAKIW